MGQPALYLSTDFVCAVLEYCQGVLERLQPVLACSYQVDVDGIADLSTPKSRTDLATDLEELGCAWALLAAKRVTPPSWLLADRLRHEGYVGMLVPSFAAHAPKNSLNLVLWEWDDRPPRQVIVIDDDRRLPRDRKSWA